MVAKIIKYWNRIAFAGVAKVDSDVMKRKVLLTNQLSMSFFLISVPVLFAFILKVPYALYVWGTACILGLCIAIPLLNSAGWNTFTRVFVCLITSISSAIFPLLGKVFLFGDDIGVAMYYIPRYYLITSMIVPMLLIDLSEKGKLFFCLAVNATFLFGFDFIDSFFGVGFLQKGYETPNYLMINFYILTNYAFLLSAMFYLQLNNRRYESKIRHLNSNLDKRVHQKTSELLEANTNLAAFNLMVSHELKTPLTAAQMLTGSMNVAYGNKLGEKGLQQLVTIDNCMAEMQGLIKSMMAFSHLGTQHEEIQILNMNALVNDALKEMETAGLLDNIRIVRNDLPPSSGDPTLIKQVWTNLLTNAAKFTRQHEPAEIQIGCTAINGEDIYFVKDKGIGFQQSEARKVFELFTRVHSKSNYKGSGVGLSIVERIILRHGGRVWAEGSPDLGATFYFTLPKAN